MFAPCLAISMATTAPIRFPPVISATLFERSIQTLYCILLTYRPNGIYVPTQERRMLMRVVGTAVEIGGIAVAPALAQAQAPAAPAPPATAPAPGTAKPAAGGGQKVGQTGNPDPGVNFLNVVENPHVRVLQVTLQPGAVRRPHVHNDVTFHMLVPINGSLELTVEK